VRIPGWKATLIRYLGGVVPEHRGTFVTQATIERSEELRVDRLGPTVEDLDDYTEPTLPYDPERPESSLGPL
jgi:hypothetical protein